MALEIAPLLTVRVQPTVGLSARSTRIRRLGSNTKLPLGWLIVSLPLESSRTSGFVPE